MITSTQQEQAHAHCHKMHLFTFTAVAAAACVHAGHTADMTPHALNDRWPAATPTASTGNGGEESGPGQHLWLTRVHACDLHVAAPDDVDGVANAYRSHGYNSSVRPKDYACSVAASPASPFHLLTTSSCTGLAARTPPRATQHCVKCVARGGVHCECSL